MKVNKNNIKIITLSLASLLLWSCAEDLDVKDGVSIPGDTIDLTVEIPGPKIVNIESRSWETPTYQEYVVYAYKSDGSFTVPASTLANGVLSFKPVEGTQRYEVAAYDKNNVNYDATKAPTQNVNSSPDKDILWGAVETSAISNNKANVKLLRHTAQVSVSKKTGAITDAGSSFELQGYDVFATSNTGTAGPAYSNYKVATLEVAAPTLPAGSTYTYNLENGKPKSGFSNSAVRVFESETGKGRIIIKGKFNGEEGYYPIAFATRAGSGNSEDPGKYQYTEIPVLRNHAYQVEIEYVREKGWDTPEEALAAKPDNRMTVLLTDTNEEISDIIACRDYMLGVEQPEEFPAWGQDGNGYTNATLTVVSSYGETPEVEINGSWIEYKAGDITEAGSYQMEVGSEKVSAKKYTIPVKLKPNTNQTETREGSIIVTVGDLSRVINVKQGVYDVYRNGSRKVYIGDLRSLGGGSGVVTNMTDYFKWLDQECNGVTPEENRGTVRNMGLHFPAVPLYNLTYYIDKEDGDQGTTITGPYTVGTATGTGTGDKYTITQDSFANPTIGEYSFTITDKSGNKITYTIYQTGIFHYLKPEDKVYQVPVDAEVKQGWYYYELVSKQGVFFLDRNLGASTNSSYISTHKGEGSDKNAVGGYFKVATKRFGNTQGKQMELQESNVTVLDGQNGIANLGKFKIMSQTELQTLQLGTENLGGDAVAIVSGVTGKVAGNKVYIPHGGYYEDSDLKNEVYANLWTRDLHCYNQGFDSQHSEEFGLWYRYLNAYPSNVQPNLISSISQMRIANGSGGDLSEDAPFRYMPLRLVWDGKDNSHEVGTAAPNPSPNPDPNPGSEDYTFQKGKKVKITWPQYISGIDMYKIYIWYYGGDTVTAAFPGDQFTSYYPTNEGQRYVYEFELDRNCNDFSVIPNRDVDPKGQTDDITIDASKITSSDDNGYTIDLYNLEKKKDL